MDAAAERLTAGQPGMRPPAPGCCGGAARPPTLTDYIDRGLRRRRAGPLPIAGAVRRDDDGRFARFSVLVSGGVIADVAFEATSCVTLVAYCELAAQRVTGLTLRVAARAIQVQALQAGLPLVPAGKRERARLAAQALMATVVEGARRQPE
jgi:hypothetical protein